MTKKLKLKRYAHLVIEAQVVAEENIALLEGITLACQKICQDFIRNFEANFIQRHELEAKDMSQMTLEDMHQMTLEDLSSELGWIYQSAEEVKQAIRNIVKQIEDKP